MRHGLSVPPFTSPATLVEAACSAESAGRDGFFLWDHLRWRRGVPMHGPWTPRDRGLLLDESLELLAGALAGPVDHCYRVRDDLRPASRPRPRIWVDGVAPNQRLLECALRWDGYVPIAGGRPVTPDRLLALLKNTEPPASWDLVVQSAPGAASEDYEALGVTWLISELSVTNNLDADLPRIAAQGPGRAGDA